MTYRTSNVVTATYLFLFTEIVCYFLFSVWWRGQVPLWIGVGLAFCHLLGLIAILSLWERWKAGVELGEPQKRQFPNGPGQLWPILILMSVGLLAQWPFFGDPVLSGPDEPVMIRDHAKQVSSLLASGPFVVGGLVLACAAAFIVSLGLVGPEAFLQAITREPASKWFWLALLVVVMLGYGLAEGASRFNWGLAERWPPLGTVLLLPLQLAGLDEIIALRLISALFYCGTAYLVFRIVHMDAGQVAAMGAAALLMTAPAFFNWGHYAFREMGGVFFFTLGVYFLQRLLRGHRAEDYALVCAVVSLGYLQRRPSVLLAGVAAITILLAFRSRLFTWTNIRALALPAMAMVWVALPWIAISSNVRVYVLYVEHLAEPGTLLSYVMALPGQAGWPLAALSFAGMISGLLARRRITWIVLCWLLLLNFLFVMDVTAPRVVDRFAIHFIPGLAILAGMALGTLTGRKLVTAVMVAVVAGFATLATWFMDDGREFTLLPRSGLRYADEPLLPFDQVAIWLERRVRELPDGERLNLYLPIPLQTSLPLYLRKNRVHRVTLHEAGRRNYRPNRDLDVAFESCRRVNCDYMVITVHPHGHLILHPDHDMASLEARQSAGVQRFSAEHGLVLLVPPPSR